MFSKNSQVTKIIKFSGRISKPDQWKRNIIKNARLSGQEYINYSGEVVPAVTMGEPCQCQRKCYQPAGRQETYEQIFKEFYAMKSKDVQDTYLCGLIQSHDVKRKRAKDNSRTPRTSSFKYFIKVPHEFFQVCRKTFVAVHGLKYGRLERLCNSLKKHISVQEDRRGQHSSRPNVLSAEVVEQVDAHMKRFITVGKKYLPKHLCLKKMHGLYLQEYEWNLIEDLKNGIETKPNVSFHFYKNHFKKHVNMPFGEDATE